MASMVVLVDGTIPVAGDFNGNFSALNNAIGSNTTITSYVTGDTLYASATNTLSKLAAGAVNKVSGIANGIPAWVGGAVVLNVNTTATGTIANTSETDLTTYSLPASSLSADGRGVEV